MPFEQISTPSIAVIAPVRSTDFVVVTMTTRTRLMFSPYRHRYGDIRLQLSPTTWPKEVRDRVELVSRELGSRGRPPLTSDFSVILAVGDVLAIARCVRVTLIYGRSVNKEYEIILRGTPAAFTTGRSTTGRGA